MTGNQAHKWPSKFFTPAVRKVAERWPKEHGDILGSTPYSLRRGMISLRIRAGEDRQTIAKQCGTSVDMLERNYSFVIEDLEDEGPKRRGGTTPCPTARPRRRHPPATGRVTRCQPTTRHRE
jgi:hypothetical protein